MSSHIWNQAFSFEELRSFTVGHTGSIVNVPCPLCGPLCRSPHNRVRKVLRIWNEADDFITYRCARCGEKGGVRDHTAATKGPRQLQQPQNAGPNKDDLRRLKIARYLYRRSLPSPAPRPKLISAYVNPGSIVRRSAFCRQLAITPRR
jgi:hypothetical protein